MKTADEYSPPHEVFHDIHVIKPKLSTASIGIHALSSMDKTMPFDVRQLRMRDLHALLELERSKWDSGQAATLPVLAQRIRHYPDLSVGVFCRASQTALASLFMCPVDPAVFSTATRWAHVAHGRAAPWTGARSLFGISLSSRRQGAVDALLRFFYPRALKAGWRDIYLGSPIPGFGKARAADPELAVRRYVHGRTGPRGQLPRDPQLAYYHRLGFREIVSIQQDYFPHPASLDYGVILRCAIPLSQLHPLWRIMPMRALVSIGRLVPGAAGRPSVFS